MNWTVFGLVAPALWALSNHIDKYLLSRYFERVSANILLIFGGIISLVTSLMVSLMLPEVLSVAPTNALIMIFNGVVLTFTLIPYFHALNEDDTSVVVPIFQSVPVFSFILGYAFLGESLTLSQILGGLLIIAGAVAISLDVSEKIRLKRKMLGLMLLSSFIFASGNLIFKYVALQEDYWTTVFWEYLAAGLVVVGLLFVPSYRNQFLGVIFEGKARMLSVNVVNESINVVANLLASFALLFAPIAVVSVVVNGLQPFYVLLLGVGLTMFFPHVVNERLEKQHLVQKLIAVAIILIGTYILQSVE